MYILLGFRARLGAIKHKIRHPKHKIYWRCNVWEEVCRGDIKCYTCGTLFWCRGVKRYG